MTGTMNILPNLVEILWKKGVLRATSRELTNQINAFDLAFIVDTTSSMTPFLRAAQQQMIAMIDELSQATAVYMRLGVVEYRDHPPQDSMVYRCYEFTDNMQQARSTINTLVAQGGGDMPEAVLAGIVATCHRLAWHPHARRVAVLVGDAPPHGVGADGDAFPDACPSGETIASVTALAEETRVTLYALGLRQDAILVDAFQELSLATGGEFFSADQGNQAIECIKEILLREFGNLDFDRRVLAEYSANPTASLDTLVDHLASNRLAVSAALTRLGSRGLIS